MRLVREKANGDLRVAVQNSTLSDPLPTGLKKCIFFGMDTQAFLEAIDCRGSAFVTPLTAALIAVRYTAWCPVVSNTNVETDNSQLESIAYPVAMIV